MLACWYRPNGSLDRKNASLTKLQKWDLDNLSSELGRAESRLLTGSRQDAEKVGRLRFSIKDCLLLRRSDRTQSAPQGKNGFVLRN